MTAAHWIRQTEVSWPLAAWTTFVVGVAVGIAAFDMRQASVDVVFSDTGGYIHMIDGFLSGNFDPAEFFKAHNQNRTAILVVALLTSTRFDHFNQRNIELLSLLFAFMTLGNFLYLAFTLIKDRPLAKGVIVLISSLAIFSLVQCGNFLLSINFVFFSTVAVSITSIVFIAWFLFGDDRKIAKAAILTVAIVLFELALFSMAGGVIVWVINIAQIGLAMVLFRVRALGGLLAYFSCAIFSLGAYLWGLSAGGSLAVLLSRPLDALRFFVIATGNSIVGVFVQGSVLGPILWLDLLVGAVLTGVFVFVFIHFGKLPRDEKKRSFVLMSILLFGLLEQALITYGRLPLGVSNAATARYAALTVVAPVSALVFLTMYGSALVVLTMYGDVSRACLSIAVATGSAILLFTVIGDRNELRIAGGRHFLGVLRQQILLDNKIGAEEQKILEWESLPDIRDGNEILRKNRLSTYYRPQ